MGRSAVQFGFATLGDIIADPATGVKMSEQQRYRGFVELGVVAEELGYDSYFLGEHHFTDYALASPTPIMAAIAERTSKIRLSTAVSLLCHHDPLRIAEDYGTVDLLSNGRVELIGGRGAYKSHFEQFGQNHEDSEATIVEAVALLKRMWTEENISWSGAIRPPLTNITVRPRPVQKPHPPIWLASTSPESAARAVALRCPIMIATVAVGIEGVARVAKSYRQQWAEAGLDPADCKVGLNFHLYVGEGSSQQVADFWEPYQMGYLRWVWSELGRPFDALPPSYTQLLRPDSQAVCGNVDDVVADVQRRLDLIDGADVVLIQCDHGGLPFDEVRKSMALFSSQVRPRLRDARKALVG